MRGGLPSLLCVLLGAGCAPETLDAGSTLPRAAGEARTLATIGSTIDAIAMDATDLYFTAEDGWVYRLAKSGGAAPTRLARAAASGSLYTEGIAVDATSVYWTALGDGVNGGAVFRAPKSGGDAEVVDDHVARPWDIAVDDTHVYWVVQSAPAPSNIVGGVGKGWIGRVDKAGGEIDKLAKDLVAPDALALDEGGGVVWHEASAIRRVAEKGAEPATLLERSQPFRTTNLVAVDGGVAWADEPGDEVEIHHVRAGEAVTTLASGVDTPAWLAPIGRDVYWNVANGHEVGEILGSPPSGGAIPVAPADVSAGRALFLLADERAFFWVVSSETKPLEVAIRARDR